MKWLDNTRLGAFRRCPEEYRLRHVLGYVSCERPEYFVAGTQYHLLWEQWLTGEMPKLGKYAHTLPENSPANIMRVWREWLSETQWFWHDAKPISVEKPIMYDFGGFVFIAKIDALVLHVTEPREPEIIVVDHKTTNAMTDDFWQAVENSAQLVGYATVAGVSKCAINACQKTLLDLSKSKKCRIHGVPKSDCWQSHVKCDLRTFDISDAQKREWHEGVLRDAPLIAQIHKHPDAEAKRTLARCERCDFFPICVLGESLPGNPKFRREKWNPVEEPKKTKKPKKALPVKTEKPKNQKPAVDINAEMKKWKSDLISKLEKMKKFSCENTGHLFLLRVRYPENKGLLAVWNKTKSIDSVIARLRNERNANPSYTPYPKHWPGSPAPSDSVCGTWPWRFSAKRAAYLFFRKTETTGWKTVSRTIAHHDPDWEEIANIGAVFADVKTSGEFDGFLEFEKVAKRETKLALVGETRDVPQTESRVIFRDEHGKKFFFDPKALNTIWWALKPKKDVKIEYFGTYVWMGINLEIVINGKSCAMLASMAN